MKCVLIQCTSVQHQALTLPCSQHFCLLSRHFSLPLPCSLACQCAVPTPPHPGFASSGHCRSDLNLCTCILALGILRLTHTMGCYQQLHPFLYTRTATPDGSRAANPLTLGPTAGLLPLLATVTNAARRTEAPSLCGHVFPCLLVSNSVVISCRILQPLTLTNLFLFFPMAPWPLQLCYV